MALSPYATMLFARRQGEIIRSASRADEIPDHRTAAVPDLDGEARKARDHQSRRALSLATDSEVEHEQIRRNLHHTETSKHRVEFRKPTSASTVQPLMSPRAPWTRLVREIVTAEVGAVKDAIKTPCKAAFRG